MNDFQHITDDFLEELLTSSNELINSVYRDIAPTPFRSVRSTRPPLADHHVSRLRGVLDSVDENLRQVENVIDVENAQPAEELVCAENPPVQLQQQIDMATSTESTSTAAVAQQTQRSRSMQQIFAPVVIDLCEDSPLQNHRRTLPEVIVLDSPSPTIRHGRKRSHDNELQVRNEPAINSAASSLLCPICLEPPRQTSATKCGHVYCKECILTAINKTHKCPICRQRINSRSIIRLHI